MYTFVVNGKTVKTDKKQSLLRFLRDELHLTSVKDGCSQGACGACTVILNGRAVNSCCVFAVQADGGSVETIEGLGTPDKPHPLQQAFIDEAAVQCGFCSPGFIMSAVEILEAKREFSDDEIRKLMSGHLCRCTGYENIFRAVKKTMLRRLGKNKEADAV